MKQYSCILVLHSHHLSSHSICGLVDLDPSAEKLVDLNTMADEAAEPEVKPCPVLSAWEKSKTVMNRLMQGCLVHLPPDTKKIKRDHLAENVELLGPLIKNVGFLARLTILVIALLCFRSCTGLCVTLVIKA